MNANEIQIPYDNHHKVSSLVKRHQNTYKYMNMKMSENPAKHEVLIKQYLRSILDISEHIRQRTTLLSFDEDCVSKQGCC